MFFQLVNVFFLFNMSLGNLHIQVSLDFGKTEDGRGKGEEGEGAYGPSVHVKTVSNPHEPTSFSASFCVLFAAIVFVFSCVLVDRSVE